MNIFLKKILLNCINFKKLNYKEIFYIFYKIYKKKISPIMLSAIIISIKIKKENLKEIYFLIKIIKKFFSQINFNNIKKTLNIIGTGGDNLNFFNISTISAFIISLSNINVIKYGNRGVSSFTGSADLLESLGINIYLNYKQIINLIKYTKIGFFFAPYYNNFIKNTILIRQELNIKTFFNIINPLINPIKIKKIIMGVYNPNLINNQIKLFKKLNIKKAIVLSGEDNLDEITLNGYTIISEIINKKIKKYKIHPKTFNINYLNKKYKTLNSIESKKKFLNIFFKKKYFESNIIIINTAISFYISKITNNIKDGVYKSRDILMTKYTLDKIKKFIYFSNLIKNK